jgi:hypothetical protein
MENLVYFERDREKRGIVYINLFRKGLKFLSLIAWVSMDR